MHINRVEHNPAPIKNNTAGEASKKEVAAPKCAAENKNILEPKDVVTLSPAAKDGGPPDYKKIEADQRMQDATSPKPNDNPQNKALKSDYSGQYHQADTWRQYAKSITEMGPGTHTFSDGTSATSTRSSDGITTVEFRDSNNNVTKSIQYKDDNDDGTYLRVLKHQKGGFLGMVDSTTTMERDGNNITTSSSKNLWVFSWGKSSKMLSLDNIYENQNAVTPPSYAHDVTITKASYNNTVHPQTSPLNPKPYSISHALNNGGAVDRTLVSGNYQDTEYPPQ